MAQKPNSGRFQPGNNANPRGARAHKMGRITRNVKLLTAQDVQDVISLVMTKNKEELKQIIDDPETKVIKVWVAMAAYKGLLKGDVVPFEALMKRCVGNVAQNVQLTGLNGGPVSLSAETPEERAERIKRMSSRDAQIQSLAAAKAELKIVND